MSRHRVTHCLRAHSNATACGLIQNRPNALLIAVAHAEVTCATCMEHVAASVENALCSSTYICHDCGGTGVEATRPGGAIWCGTCLPKRVYGRTSK